MHTGAGLGQQMQQEQQQPLMKIEGKKMRVMVAIDESDGSFYALKWTLDNLANSINPGTIEPSQEETGMVTLVHVQQPFQYYVYPAGPGGAGLI